MDRGGWSTPETFDHGHTLNKAVCERGLEGVVVKPQRQECGGGRASPARGMHSRQQPFFVAGSATSKMDETEAVPSADHVTLTVTGAGPSASGTVYMFYDRHRA